MINNNPIDLATKMSRYEKRLTAIRLLKEIGTYVRTWQEICWAIALIATIVVGLMLSLKAVISIEFFSMLLISVSIINVFVIQLRMHRRQIKALTDLVILREEEIDEAENEQALQRSNQGKSGLNEAAP